MPSLDAYAEKIKGIFDLTADMSYATQFKKNQVPNMNRKGLHNNTPPQKKCCTKKCTIMLNMHDYVFVCCCLFLFWRAKAKIVMYWENIAQHNWAM